MGGRGFIGARALLAAAAAKVEGGAQEELVLKDIVKVEAVAEDPALTEEEDGGRLVAEDVAAVEEGDWRMGEHDEGRVGIANNCNTQLRASPLHVCVKD